MNQEKKVYEVLDALDIEYDIIHHDAVYTVADVKKSKLDFEAVGCKNLFLKDNKGKNHFLVIVEYDKSVDLNQLGTQNGWGRLGFASESRLMTHLGLTHGSVSPFGIINNKDCSVKVIVDECLLDAKKLSFHPNVNTVTIVLSSDDFIKYLNSRENEVHLMNVPSKL
jgi:Ala-tRNA(Pro) deacylase